MFTISQLAKQCNGKLISKQPDLEIDHLRLDSRRTAREKELFIAIKGQRFDGHDFIEEVIKQGNQAFLISDKNKVTAHPNLSWIIAKDTKQALQDIAAHHRKQFQLPVVGITGSYGKTIIKEWLFQLLSPNYYVVKSPKSYNSQIGVPLSILQIHNHHTFGIFEAGISLKNEMELLEKVIQPNIGIFTNLGDAHAEGFTSLLEKGREKAKLFRHCETIICQANSSIEKELRRLYPSKTLLTWKIKDNKVYCLNQSISLPNTSDPFFYENISHCIALLLHLKIPNEEINKRIKALETLPMRLQIVNGKQGNIILNDSYSNDLSGLAVCIAHAKQIEPNKPMILILSTFQESGLQPDELQQKLKALLTDEPIEFLVLIGSFFKKNQSFFSTLAKHYYVYSSTTEAIKKFDWSKLTEQMIVVKGARIDRLEQIVNELKEKTHQTVWEINLSHFIENLNYFRSQLQQGVKLLAMVKASAYGTEANKLAQTLQQQRVDYLGVAYPDEALALRAEQIRLPILVMNCSPTHFQKMVEHQLEILLFSLEQLKELLRFCKTYQGARFPVHIKLETGMNRLGFAKNQIDELIDLLQHHKDKIEVRGILSHLAVADNPNEEEFTQLQIERFLTMANQIKNQLDINPILHMLNSSGLMNSQLPQFDMVRLGIGLHGISNNETTQQHIKQVGKMVTTISQIKTIQAGESVGYGRGFIATKETIIAVISVGYADGYDRRLGNGVGQVIVHGKRAHTVGAICMDMAMIDISHIPEAKPGDEVILTNEELTIAFLAKKINTIPYELLTSISTRVPRRFIYE